MTWVQYRHLPPKWLSIRVSAALGQHMGSAQSLQPVQTLTPTRVPFAQHDQYLSTADGEPMFSAINPVTKHDAACRIIADIEEWAPLVKRLNHKQGSKLKSHLIEMAVTLGNCAIVGSQKHQFSLVKRLSKILEEHLKGHNFLDEIIEKRMDSLLAKKARHGNSNAQEADNKGTQAEARFPLLEALTSKHGAHSDLMDGHPAPTLVLNGTKVILESANGERTTLSLTLAAKDVTSLLHYQEDQVTIYIGPREQEMWKLTFAEMGQGHAQEVVAYLCKSCHLESLKNFGNFPSGLGFFCKAQ